MKAPFQITGHVFEQVDGVVVEVEQDGHVGRGEGIGVYYRNENVDKLMEQVDLVRPEIERGATLEDLAGLMPPGGARNAVDCALWDLETKLAGVSIWALTGVAPKPLYTVFTIGIEVSPARMAEKAERAKDYPVLKIKLDGEKPVERMAAIRKARPDAELVIDANQGFSARQLEEVLPEFAALGVAMVEQPLRRGDDDSLKDIQSPIPICADESCLHSGEFDLIASRYDMINIKLDKTGGLSGALDLAKKARDAGKKLMVGNMLGSSLSMAPGFVVAQLCDFVDLDGPLNLKSDYVQGMRYEGARVSGPAPGFWGGMA